MHRSGAVLGARLSEEAQGWSRADWAEELRSSSSRCQVLKGWDDNCVVVVVMVIVLQVFVIINYVVLLHIIAISMRSAIIVVIIVSSRSRSSCIFTWE